MLTYLLKTQSYYIDVIFWTDPPVAAIGWTVSLQNPYGEVLIPSVTVFGDHGHMEVIKVKWVHKGRVLSVKISVLRKGREIRAFSYCTHSFWGKAIEAYNKNMIFCEPETQPSPEFNHGALSSQISSLQNCEKLT